jgi:LacI family transcriptional regulator
MKDAVLAKATEMGYRTGFSPQSKGNIIAVVVPEINNYFYSQVLEAIQVGIKDKYLLSIFCSFNSVEIERLIISNLDPSKISCLVLSKSMDAEDSSYLKEVEKKGIPIIMFNRVDYNYECPKFVIDDYMDSYVLTSHLITSNYRRIAFAAKHYNCPIYKERIRAYKDVLDKNNIMFNPDYLIYSELTNEDIHEVIQLFFNRNPRPDALILPGFMAALQATSIAKVNNISIPNDLGIVSFDADPECIYSYPSITGIERPLKEIGTEIAELILTICNKKPYLKNAVRVFKSHLIVRGSSLKKI